MPKNETPAPAAEPSEHQYLLEDLERARVRAAGSKYIEAQKEFAEEAYPLVQELTDHFGARMDRLEKAMDALIDETESFLQPDLANQILATLEMGKQVAEAMMQIKAGSLDEMAVKRLHQAAGAYLTAAEMTIESVATITLEPEDEGGDGEDDTDAEDEGDGEDEDEDEADEKEEK